MASGLFVKGEKRELVQWVCNAFFLLIVLVGLFFVVLLHLQVIPNVQDNRCKCVCPHQGDNLTVYVQLGSVPSECVCQNVVPAHLSSNDTDSYCTLCTCTFETRNNFLVKFIIVMMIILVLALLFVTMYHILKKGWHHWRTGRSIGYERIPSQDVINIQVTRRNRNRM